MTPNDPSKPVPLEAEAVEAAARFHHERMRQDRQNIVSVWDDISESWRQETREWVAPIILAADEAREMRVERETLPTAEPMTREDCYRLVSDWFPIKGPVDE